MYFNASQTHMHAWWLLAILHVISREIRKRKEKGEHNIVKNVGRTSCDTLCLWFKFQTNHGIQTWRHQASKWSICHNFSNHRDGKCEGYPSACRKYSIEYMMVNLAVKRFPSHSVMGSVCVCFFHSANPGHWLCFRCKIATLLISKHNSQTENPHFLFYLVCYNTVIRV